MNEKDGFEDVIFSDETTVEIQQYTRFCFRQNGSLPKRKGRPKHPLKVISNELSKFMELICQQNVQH